MFPGQSKTSNPFAGYQPTQAQEQYGPFTQALTARPGETSPTTVSGYGGPKEALAMFATKFLEGAQGARRKAFEQSEQHKMEQSRNLDQTLAMIQSGPYTAEAKQKASEAVMRARMGEIEQHIDGQGGSGGGSGSGGKKAGGGGGKDKAGGGNPLLHLAKQFIGGVLGPTEDRQHVDYGGALHTLASIVHEPGSRINLGQMTEQATGAINGALQSAKDVESKSGVKIDRQTLLATPTVQKALNSFTANGMDWRQVPEIASLIEGTAPPLDEVQRAQLAREKSLTSKTDYDLEQEKKGAREPYLIVTKDEKGQQVSQIVDRNSVSGKLFKPGSEEEVKAPENAKLIPSAASVYASDARTASDENRLQMQERLEKMRESSREMIARFTQGHLDKRFYAGIDMKGDVDMLKAFDALMERRAAVAKQNTKNPADRQRLEVALKNLDDQIAEQRPGFEHAYQRLQTAGAEATEAPPVRGERNKKEKGEAGGGGSATDDLVKKLLAPDAPASTAKPPTGKTPDPAGIRQ